MRTIFTAVLLFAFGIADAQIEKGTWTLGSNLAISKLEFKTKYTEIRLFINPSAQLFISNRVAIGAGLDLDYSNVKQDTFAVNSNFNWGIGPSMRYYFTASDKGGAFGQLKFYFGGNKNGSSTLNPELNFGYDFILNSFMGLEIFAGYGIVIPLKSGETLGHKVPIGIGFQIFLSK